jgi:hypothetical protein
MTVGHHNRRWQYRMGPKGVSKNDIKNQLEGRLDSLSKWLEKWTALVVIGLVVEVASEVFKEATGQSLRFSNLVGEVLIMIWVAGELWVEVRNRQISDKLREVTDSIISELNAETEKLRKENNNRELLTRYRSIGDTVALENAMRQYAGTEYVIEFQTEQYEASRFQWELTTFLGKAGWVLKGYPRPISLGFGAAVLTVTERNKHIPESAAGIALVDWLYGQNIAVYSAVVARSDHREPSALVIQLGPRPEVMEQHEIIRAGYAARRSSRPTDGHP